MFRKHIKKQILLFRVVFFAFYSFCTIGHADSTIYNVRDFGAKGDRQTPDHPAIQTAIDACAEVGGGTVLLPPGDYLSGTIQLRSNVTLNLSAGATLWASTDPTHYPGKSSGRLLTANDAEHIAIIGEGVINGQGTADYGARWGAPDKPAFRTGVLLFEQCRHVVIRDVTILYSDSWTVHLKRCDNVSIDGVTIFNNIHRLNSDGIDPNSCSNVRISNCHIVAGDDCIVLKSTESYPCQNVVVTNCTLESTATALKLGTESQGDFRDVHFSNCAIRDTRTGIGFYMKDGATMERITFSDISIQNNKGYPPHDIYPIFMDIEKRHADTKIGRIRDVIFHNIQIEGGSGILIQGVPESPIENLTLDTITLRAAWADDYKNRKKAIGGSRTFRDDRDTRFARLPSYLSLAFAQHVTVDNVRVIVEDDAYTQYPRSAFYGVELTDITLRSVFRNQPDREGNCPMLSLQNCQNVLLTGNNPPKQTHTFLSVSGPNTSTIALKGNNFQTVKNPAIHSEDVNDRAIIVQD